MKKIKNIVLTTLTALTLTSCSLFSDADIAINNNFKPKEQSSDIVVTDMKIGDVYGVKSDVENTVVFKNVVYSNVPGENKIRNSYTTAEYSAYNVNNGNDYEVNKDNNNFDLYVPNGLNKNAKHNVVLFIHGGAWISGLKTQVNPYVKRFAKEGYIAATIEYTLLDKDIIDSSSSDKDATNSPLSIFRDLDEIDACISTMKSGLGDLGFNTSKLNLVLGGGSSGAHLAMLYAYSRGDTSPMPIKFLIDAVGPTDIKEAVWKTFDVSTEEEYNDALDAGIEDSGDGNVSTPIKALPVAGQGYNWNEYQTMRIANGMCGMPFSINDVENSADASKITVADKSSDVYKTIVSNAVSGQDLLSVTHYMTSSNKIKMICAYAGEDTVVGINQFANLQHKLDDLGTEYEYFYFKHCGHVDIDKDKTTYNLFINKILEWMSSTEI